MTLEAKVNETRQGADGNETAVITGRDAYGGFFFLSVPNTDGLKAGQEVRVLVQGEPPLQHCTNAARKFTLRSVLRF